MPPPGGHTSGYVLGGLTVSAPCGPPCAWNLFVMCSRETLHSPKSWFITQLNAGLELDLIVPSREETWENGLVTTVWMHLSRWVFPPEDRLGLSKFCGWQVHFHSFCRPWYVLDLSQWDAIISAPAQKERLAHEMCARHANYSLKWITAWSRKSMRSLSVTIHLYIYTHIVLYICLCVCVCIYI